MDAVKPTKRKRTAPLPPVGAPGARAPVGDVFSTLVAVAVAASAGVAWLTPLILAAPLAFYQYRGGAHPTLFRRWAVTVLLAMAAAAAFAPPRAFQSVPLGEGVAARVGAWLRGDAGPPLGARYMAVVFLAYAAAAVASEGVGGAVVYASALATNAVHAVFLYSQGYNVLQMTLVALSPWQACFLVGIFFIHAPLSVLSRERVVRRRAPREAPTPGRRRARSLALGAGLVAVAFVLRLVCAVWYEALVRRWTIY